MRSGVNLLRIVPICLLTYAAEATTQICMKEQLKFERGHVCGVLPSSRAPHCWGYNGEGEISAPPGNRWRQLSAGRRHTCGVTETGDATCWGRNLEGQIHLPQNVNWRAVSAGDQHSCGVSTSGAAYCVGKSDHHTNLPTGGMSRTAIPPSLAWRSISAGSTNTCGVNTTGGGFCWGRNDYGQNDLPGGHLWRDISAGEEHSCGITDTGGALCWGSQRLVGKSKVPQANVAQWTMISAGYLHTCGRASDGRDLCWGPSADYRMSMKTAYMGSFMVMRSGKHLICSVNQTSLAGSCHENQSSPNMWCDVMCYQDLPQLLIDINNSTLAANSMAQACQNCCTAPPTYPL